MTRALLVTFALAAAACGNGGGDDIATPIDAFASTCGMPGDLGNELGVGKFCVTLNDCGDTVEAPLCSSFGDPTTFFCTKLCQPPGDAGVNPCGTGAECVCSGSCGCAPTSCLD